MPTVVSHRLAKGYRYSLNSYGPGAEWGIAPAGDGRLSTAADCPYGVLPWELLCDRSGRVKAFVFQGDTFTRFDSADMKPFLREGRAVFRYEPYSNDWHEGTLTQHGDTWQWKNLARVEWSIVKTSTGRLATTPDCPYGVLPWELQLDTEGGVVAFVFQGDTYCRT